MSDPTVDSLLRLAQTEIAKVLSELEVTTGRYVDGVEICDIEVTQMRSKGKDFIRRVRVNLRKTLGSRWET